MNYLSFVVFAGLFVFTYAPVKAENVPQEIHQELDHNGDNLISEEEWLKVYVPENTAMAGPEGAAMKTMMRDIFLEQFHQLDDDGDGFLTPEEAYRQR